MAQLKNSHSVYAMVDAVVCKLAAGAFAIQGGRGCLLTFHRIAPPDVWAGLPDRNFYLRVDFLDVLLTSLKRSGWTVATIGEILEAGGAARAKPLVNFSIDDCYADTYEHAVPLFRHHNAPVTLFITTGIPDRSFNMLWAGLEAIVARSDNVHYADLMLATKSPEEKRAAYQTIWPWLEAGGETAFEALCRDNGFDPAATGQEGAVTWEMLAEMAADPLVELGGHSVTHKRIASLPPHEAQAEIADCRERLQARLGRPVRHFAFPYGRNGDCGPRDFALAREAGYSSVATTYRGLVRRGGDSFTLPRNNLSGARQNAPMIAASLAGVKGANIRI